MSGKSIPKIEGFLATKSLRDDVLNEMADYLAAKGAVKPSYGAAVIARENVFPTGIPCEPIGVAIPHSDRALVEDTTILVAKLPQGVTFTRIDDGDLTVDVRVVFMLAVAFLMWRYQKQILHFTDRLMEKRKKHHGKQHTDISES